MLPRYMWTEERLKEKSMQSSYGNIEKGYETFRKSERPLKRPTILHLDEISPANWMSLLDDDTPLPALIIPGTHDSAAYTYSWPFVATQKMDILDQLNIGIRYFDLRCGVREDVVQMVHGPTYLGLKLAKVLNTMYKWLNSHSDEALIVQIKEDRESERSTVHFAHAIFRLLAKKSERWRTASTTPTLGELRGRIQLFRRYVGPNLYAYGLDVSLWVDNPADPFTIRTIHGVRITIQDHYNYPVSETLPSLISKKGVDVSELLDRANKDEDTNHWFMNFTSAYALNMFHQLSPRQIAVGSWSGFRWIDGINIRLRGYINEDEKSKNRFGIVAMDFPEQGADDLVDALILTNFKPSSSLTPAASLFWLAIFMLLIFLGYFYWATNHGPSTPPQIAAQH